MDCSSSPGDPPPTLSTSSSSSSNKYPQTPGTVERLPTVKDLLSPEGNLSDNGGAARSREFKLSPMKGTLRETNNNAPSTFPTSSSESSLSSSAINLDDLHYHHPSSSNNPVDSKNNSHFTSFDSSPISGTGSSLFSSPFASTSNDNTTPARRSAAKRRARSGASDQQGGVPTIKTRAQRRAETGSSSAGGGSTLPCPDDVFTVGRKRGRSAEDEGEDRSAEAGVEGARIKEEVDVFGPSAPIVVVAVASCSSSGSNAVEENHTFDQDSRKGSTSSSSSAGGGEGGKSNKKKRAAPPTGMKEAITFAIGSAKPLSLREDDISSPHSSHFPHPRSLSLAPNVAGNGAGARSSSWNGQIPLDRLPVDFHDSLHLHQDNFISSHSQHSHDYASEHGEPPLDPSLIHHGQQPIAEHQQHLPSAPPLPPLPSLPPPQRFPSTHQDHQDPSSNSLDLHFDQEISAEQMRLRQLEIAGEQQQQQQQMGIRHPQMTPQQQHAAATSFYESISGGAGTGLQLQQTPLSFTLSAEQLQILEQQQVQSLQFFDPTAPLSSTEAQNQLAFAAVFAAMGQSDQPGAFEHHLHQHGDAHPMSACSSSSQHPQNQNASSSSVPSSAIAGPSSHGFGGFPESPSPFQHNLGYQQAQAMLDAQGNDHRSQLYFNGEAGGLAQNYFHYGQQQGVPPNYQFSFGAQQHQQHQDPHHHHQMDVGPLDTSQMDGVVPQFGYPPPPHHQHHHQHQLMPAFVPSPSMENNNNRPNPSRSNSLDDDWKPSLRSSSPPSPSNSKPLLPAAVTSIRPSGAAVTRRYSLPNKPGSEELTLLCPDASPPPNYRPATANAAARRPSMGSRSSSFNSGLGSLGAEEREKEKKPLTASGGVQVGRFGRHELKKPKFPFLKVAKKEEEDRKFGFGGNGEGEMGGEEGGREEDEEDDGDAEKIMSQFAMSGGGGMPRIVCTVKGCRKSFKHRGAALENHIKSHSSKPDSSSSSLDGPSSSTNNANAKPSSSSKPAGARKASTGNKRRASKYNDDRWNSDDDDDDEEEEAVSGDSDEEWREPVKGAAGSGGGAGRKRR